MLRSAKDLRGQAVLALDGEIGKITDILFDDQGWMVRHLVVDTGLLFGRKVLIAPLAVLRAEGTSRTVSVDLTKEAVKNSPSIDTDAPVSRQMERSLHDHYRWPYYWSSPVVAYGGVPPVPPANSSDVHADQPEGDPHLRSAREVQGYDIEATDGGIGHVEDFIVDDRSWAVRYVVVDTSNWWFGQKVLVDPEWIDAIDWARREMQVDLPRTKIEQAPQWDPSEPVNRAYEARLYDFYGRPAYWTDQSGGPHRSESSARRFV